MSMEHGFLPAHLDPALLRDVVNAMSADQMRTALHYLTGYCPTGFEAAACAVFTMAGRVAVLTAEYERPAA